jgi:hypothetical protein
MEKPSKLEQSAKNLGAILTSAIASISPTVITKPNELQENIQEIIPQDKLVTEGKMIGGVYISQKMWGLIMHYARKLYDLGVRIVDVPEGESPTPGMWQEKVTTKSKNTQQSP